MALANVFKAVFNVRRKTKRRVLQTKWIVYYFAIVLLFFKLGDLFSPSQVDSNQFDLFKDNKKHKGDVLLFFVPHPSGWGC